MTRMRTRRAMLGVLVLTAVATAACSGEDDAGTSSPRTTVETTTPPTSAPTSAVDISALTTQLVEAPGTPFRSAVDQLADLRYREQEYLLSGVANTYTGPANGPATVAQQNVPFTTRLMVRMPDDPERFSGRVVLEPLNTSGGVDLDAAWGKLATKIAADGDGWIGVTDRSTSVAPLQEYDATRYAALNYPTNGLAWDMLAQLGGLLKEGGDANPVGTEGVEHLYMTGYSQSGIETSTFLSAFHDAARMNDGSPIYDGYLPMARSGSMTPLESQQSGNPAFEHLPLDPVDVPVIEFQGEGDAQGFSAGYTSPGGAEVRGTDNDYYRLYEVAGSAHAVNNTCDGPPTTFPIGAFARAAYANLVAWAEDGVAAPSADPIETETVATVSTFAHDEYGNVRGGVRSPFVDVPLATYFPTDTPGVFCMLSGRESVFPPADGVRLYGDAATYLSQFEASLDKTIDRGFLLDLDREAIMENAREHASAVFGTS